MPRHAICVNCSAKLNFAVSCSQVRVFELGQLGMKFERHLDAEVVDFQVGRL